MGGREEELPVKDKVPGAAFPILHCFSRVLPGIPNLLEPSFRKPVKQFDTT